jgi:Cys-tRNA(Pro)/Cys-tRNA(Cys) deacylase
MKLPSHEYLDRLGIPYETLEFPNTTEKGAANVAHALNLLEHQCVKTLIFQVADTGEKSLIMVGGDESAISGHLKKALGSRNISLAHPDDVKATTGYVIGSVPPFHWQPEGFRSFVDASLIEHDILGVGAGSWGNEILITPANLVKASNAHVVNLTRRDQPFLIETVASS